MVAAPRLRSRARPSSLEPDDDSTSFRIRQAGPRLPIEGDERAVAWATMRVVQAAVGAAYALTRPQALSVDTGQPDLFEPERACVEADVLCGGWWPRADYVLVSDRPHLGVWPDGWSMPSVGGGNGTP